MVKFLAITIIEIWNSIFNEHYFEQVCVCGWLMYDIKEFLNNHLLPTVILTYSSRSIYSLLKVKWIDSKLCMYGFFFYHFCLSIRDLKIQDIMVKLFHSHSTWRHLYLWWYFSTIVPKIWISNESIMFDFSICVNWRYFLKFVHDISNIRIW